MAAEDGFSMFCVTQAPGSVPGILVRSMGGSPTHLTLSFPGSYPGSFCLAPAHSFWALKMGRAWGGDRPGFFATPQQSLNFALTPENGAFVPTVPSQCSGPGFLKASGTRQDLLLPVAQTCSH